MGRVDAGTIAGSGRVVYRTTVHGPVTGYAKVKGRTVAVSRKRASYGQDVLWQLAFRDLTVGKVRSAETFRDAFRDSPFTFNVGYADDQDIAMYSAGNLPVRPRSVDPRLPVKGTGEYEWRGFISSAGRPFQTNPASGVLVNWNNRPAPGWGAADDNWSYGSTQRVRMLEAGIAKRGVHDLASVTSAMNAAATQDLRSVALTPVVDKLLRAQPAGADAARDPDARPARGLARRGLLPPGPRPRRRHGRRARPAIWDAFYPKLWAAAMPVDGLSDFVGTNSGPSSGFTGGGFWYLEKDLGRLNGDRVQGPVQRALLRRRRRREVRRGDLEGAGRRARATRRATRGCERGADRVPARTAADHDPLHEPAERDPAGDLVRPAPAALGARSGAQRRRRRRQAAGVPRPSWRTPPWMIAFWPAYSMWNMNVFEPPMLTDTAVWLAASVSAPSPLPTRRATLTVCPDWLMNVMTEIGSSLPAAPFWSLQVAVIEPRPLINAANCGAPGALSATSRPC